MSVHLTDRALSDLTAIFAYTCDRWGEKKAERYLDDAEAALTRIARYPGLLQAREEFHSALRFYVMNEHVFVCDFSTRRIIILTILAARIDIVSRLARLEPTLVSEVELLTQQLESLDNA